MGIEKARVLPEPVLPRPSTSRPPRVSGRVSTWIGNAVVLPSAARDFRIGAGTPSELKVTASAVSSTVEPAAVVFSVSRVFVDMWCTFRGIGVEPGQAA
nr:hypothetical protein GCM10025699_68110 [Microbacterium flavescens]